MYYNKIVVTPQLANEILTASGKNRPLKIRRVAAIADDMANGRWSESPQPIAFDLRGNLIDGQHRLAAVVKANVPVEMWAAYGVNPSVVIDRGVSRSTSDSLYMRDAVPATLASHEVVAIVRRYNTIKNGDKPMTDDMIAEFINENKDALQHTIEYTHKRGSSVCRKAGVQAGIFAALKEGAPKEAVQSFAYVANTGFMGESKQSAAIVLRNFVISEAPRGWSGSNRLAACTQMAIHDYVNGVERTKPYKTKRHLYIRPELEAS